MKVVHPRQSGNDRGKRGRHRGFGRVGQVRLAVEQIAVNLRLKGLAHLARGS